MKFNFYNFNPAGKLTLINICKKNIYISCIYTICGKITLLMSFRTLSFIISEIKTELLN